MNGWNRQRVLHVALGVLGTVGSGLMIAGVLAPTVGWIGPAMLLVTNLQKVIGGVQEASGSAPPDPPSGASQR